MVSRWWSSSSVSVGHRDNLPTWHRSGRRRRRRSGEYRPVGRGSCRTSGTTTVAGTSSTVDWSGTLPVVTPRETMIMKDTFLAVHYNVTVRSLECIVTSRFLVQGVLWRHGWQSKEWPLEYSSGWSMYKGHALQDIGRSLSTMNGVYLPV